MDGEEEHSENENVEMPHLDQEEEMHSAGEDEDEVEGGGEEEEELEEEEGGPEEQPPDDVEGAGDESEENAAAELYSSAPEEGGEDLEEEYDEGDEGLPQGQEIDENDEENQEQIDDDEEEHAPEAELAAPEANNNDGQSSEAAAAVAAKRKRSASHSSADEGPKRKVVRSSGSVTGKHDSYCWVCHKDGVQTLCKICPRAYHAKCIHVSVPEETGKTTAVTPAEVPTKTCICPECAVVMSAENLETRSDTMKQLTVDQLISMLKSACQRMKTVPGMEPFMYPVDPAEAEDYYKYVVYPMDLSTLENNVKKRQYGSTEAFLADAQWLVHNSVVFNSATSPFTVIAKKILKICRQEIQDIEICPECYVNAHNKPKTWFLEVCKRPHILVWAKLKGFPFWPAKAMRVKDDMVDVRFFGAHDRAWVMGKDCFLYSVENPSTSTPKRNNALLTAIDELNAHIENLKENYGPFEFAKSRTPIGSQLSIEQIRQMLPQYVLDDSSTSKNFATPTPAKKSPMTIRISSLKTNPTIVTNSVLEQQATNSTPRIKLTDLNSKSIKIATTEAAEESEQPEEQQEPSSEDNDSAVEQASKKSVNTNNNTTTPAAASGILATALAGRPTRRGSRSDAGSASPANSSQELSDKKGMPATSKHSSQESDESDHQHETGTTPPPPDSFLASIGLRKTSEVNNLSKPKSALGKLLHPSEVFVKPEPQDDEEFSDGGGGVPIRKSHQELVNQISGGKPNMRFNLSKDISISPVGDDNSGDGTGEVRRRPIIHQTGQRIGLMGQNQMMGRPRQMISTNGGMHRISPGGQQNRLMMRNQQQQRLGVPGGMRPGMKLNGPRPQGMHQMMQMKQQHQRSKDMNSALVIDPSSLQGQGGFSNAITLPGGTITVTPLAPVIGVAMADNSGVLANQDGTQSLLKSNNKPSSQRQRTLMNQVPAAVGHLVQNLQKNLVENVKSSMEQIIVEMLEKTNSTSSGGPEMKALKEENERLKKRVNEFMQTHDSTVRDMTIAMEAEKKRLLNEQKRHFEQEKAKAIEETKKKQWCARCGREAQFYCCWNTSYCGYPCQEDHWPSHMNSCSQGSTNGGK